MNYFYARPALVFLFATGLLAGPADSKAQGTTLRIIEHSHLSRQYLLHLPNGKTPTEPKPLIIALHGATMNGALMEGMTMLSKLSDSTKEFTVAYPSGDQNGGPGVWDFFSPMGQGRDDVGFIKAVIDQIVAEKIADPKRIYITGLSNGAFLANRLSIDLGDKIAAIAPIAGTFPIVVAKTAEPKRPMPVMYFHGTLDKLVGIDGSDFITKGKNSLSALDYCSWWAEKNHLPSMEPTKEKLPDVAPNDTCRVEKMQWTSTAAPVIFYQITGGGHTWPGGAKGQPEDFLGKVCRDINASRLMWDFFQKHALP